MNRNDRTRIHNTRYYRIRRSRVDLLPDPRTSISHTSTKLNNRGSRPLQHILGRKEGGISAHPSDPRRGGNSVTSIPDAAICGQRYPWPNAVHEVLIVLSKTSKKFSPYGYNCLGPVLSLCEFVRSNGFALAKGLTRGLNRCPNRAMLILVYYQI